MSDNLQAAWELLWEYIANDDWDEDYSYGMAERLCETVLPQVWDMFKVFEAEVNRLNASNKAIVAQGDKAHERNMKYKADNERLVKHLESFVSGLLTVDQMYLIATSALSRKAYDDTSQT